MHRNDLSPLENLPLEISHTLITRHLTLRELKTLGMTSKTMMHLFHEFAVWRTLLKRDFFIDSSQIPDPQKIYSELHIERNRLATYTQVFPTSTRANRVSNRFTLVDPRSATMRTLRHHLQHEEDALFFATTKLMLQNINADFVQHQKKDLLQIYDKLFLATNDQCIETLDQTLDIITHHHNNRVALNPMSETWRMMVMLSLLSKCGGTHSLSLLLNKLEQDREVKSKFMTYFGAFLCCDAILYRRPAMLTTLFQHGLPSDATANYHEFMEDTELTPLSCALKCLHAFYHEQKHAGENLVQHAPTLDKFNQMITLLCHAGVDPDQPRIEYSPQFRGPAVALNSSHRDYANLILKEIDNDTRLHQDEVTLIANILSNVTGARVVADEDQDVIMQDADDFDDVSDDDSQDFTSPTKKTRLDTLTLSGPSI